MNEIKGKLNVFKFIGTFNNETGEFTNDTPTDTEKFIFTLEDDNTCYVETDVPFEYDELTGSFYMIKEDL